MDWGGVYYLWIIVMCLSALILTAPIHCRASIGASNGIIIKPLFNQELKTFEI